MKEFLLSLFENNQYPGWKSIATKLIDGQTPVVAGTKCIWSNDPNIGNFIKTQSSVDYIDCLLYKFDMDGFKKSKFYKENIKLKLQNLDIEIDNRKEELEKLISLKNNILNGKI